MMSELLSAVKRQLTDFFQNRSKKQLVVIGAAAAALVVTIVIAASFLGKEEYEVLYTGLDQSEAGEIMLMLEDMDVTAKAQGSNTILILSDSADEVRMTLAAEGYPESGLNYDIFADSSSLGTTDLQTQTYLQYQLQENLRCTIMKLDRIEDCVVIVNMPSESLFVLSSDETEASASIMLEIEHGETLASDEVQAIANLALKSVSGLQLENISIVDSGMNFYDILGQDEEEYTMSQYNLTQLTQETYQQQVLTVLTPVFGEENVSAAVNVVMNFDKETISSVEFDTPIEGDENGLAVSMEELYEVTKSDGTDAEGTAGTDSNGVTLSEYVYEDANLEDFQSISRTVNYELNELHTEIVKQQGNIDKITVAVLLNSGYSDEDYSEEIIRLVSKATGVDEEYVSVESLPFKASADETGITDVFDQQASLLDSLKQKELIKTIIIAGTILMLALFVLRFLMQHGKTRGQMAVVSGGEAPDEWMNETNRIDAQVDEEIELVGKSKSIEMIESFVDKNPAAAAQLLRNWLVDEDM